MNIYQQHYSISIIFLLQLGICNPLKRKILFFSFIRYHFESHKGRFLPTLTFSGGRVDVSVLWPDAVEQLPDIINVLKEND